MEVFRVICLFLVLDLSLCHVLRVEQKPQSVHLDDVKKERIHFPQGLDEKVRPKRQVGRDAEYVLDSSNGYGLGRPSQNQDILNGNYPTNPTVDIPVGVSPNIGINPGFGADDDSTLTQSRQTTNNGNTFPAGNVGNNANPNNRRATSTAGSNARASQGNNNRFVNNPGVLTTNANAAVNLGFGMPPVDNTPDANNGNTPDINNGNAPGTNVGNGPEVNVGGGYADQGAWTFPDRREYDPHHGHYDHHHDYYGPHQYWDHHYYG